MYNKYCHPVPRQDLRRRVWYGLRVEIPWHGQIDIDVDVDVDIVYRTSYIVGARVSIATRYIYGRFYEIEQKHREVEKRYI